MFRPIITKVNSRPLQSFFRSSFGKKSPFASSFLATPVVKRFATHQSIARPGLPTQAKTFNWPKIAGQAALFGGSYLAINAFFNRETREGGIPAVEQQYLHDTFKYVGAGVGLTALFARGLHSLGWSARLMAMNPWVVIIGGVALSIGTFISRKVIDFQVR